MRWPDRTRERDVHSKLIHLLTFIFLHFHVQGDSGGPVTYKQGDQHLLVGVMSQVDPGLTDICGKGSYFCRVAHVRDWIATELSGATYCARDDGDWD